MLWDFCPRDTYKAYMKHKHLLGFGPRMSKSESDRLEFREWYRIPDLAFWYQGEHLKGSLSPLGRGILIDMRGKVVTVKGLDTYKSK